MESANFFIVILIITPVISFFISAMCFRVYYVDKKANKALPPQERRSTSGVLAAAITFCAIGVIFTAFIVMLIIIYNEVMNHM